MLIIKLIYFQDLILELLIFDFLQSYNFYKLVEFKYKTAISGQNADAKGGISCVNPKLYSERFINYVNNMTQTKHTIIGKNKE